MRDLEVESKLKYILIEISKQKGGEDNLIELLQHSSFKFENHWNQSSFPELYNLEISTLPDIFTKNYAIVENYSALIRSRLNKSSKLLIDKVKILPDYNKLSIIDSQVLTVITEWEEINLLQNKLIESLKRSQQAIDFQSIGLMARTIMDKISRLVFNPEIYKPKDEKISVSNGKFKNQLHTYIDYNLSGENNSEFRKLAKSAIDFVEDSIDIMNTTTHKLNAEKHFAEVCIISTISAISLINLIRQLEKNNQ